MKLKLRKKSVKALSADNALLPEKMTPHVAGGTFYTAQGCPIDFDTRTSYSCTTKYCPETSPCYPDLSWNCNSAQCYN